MPLSAMTQEKVKRLSFVVMPHGWRMEEIAPPLDIFKAISGIKPKHTVDYYDLHALFNKNAVTKNIFAKINKDEGVVREYFTKKLRHLIKPSDYYIFYIPWWHENLNSSIWLSRQLKREHAGCKVLFFGPYAKAYYKEILQNNDCVDGVFVDAMDGVIGELSGGKDFEDLDNMSFRQKEKIGVNPRRLYSFSDKTYVDYEKYSDFIGLYRLKKSPFVYYELSQGCRHNCFYCFDLKSRKLVVKGVDFAVGEMMHIAGQLKCPNFYFIDNALNFRHDFLLDFLKKLKKKSKGYKWSAYLIPKDIDEGLLKDLQENGCVHIRWGIESLNPLMHKKISKNLDLSKVPAILSQASQCGIRNQVSLITGFPHEGLVDRDLMGEFITKHHKVLDCVNVYKFKVRRETVVYRSPKAFGIEVLHEKDDGTMDGIPFNEVGGLGWEKKRLQQEASLNYLQVLLSQLRIQNVDPRAFFINLIK